MRSVHDPLSPGDEVLELRDIGAPDCTPTINPDAFPPDDTDDPEFVAAMQQREAARLAGYVDALCVGCGCLLYVPDGTRCGDVLCRGCQVADERLAAAEDAGPVPPRDTPEYFVPIARRLGDDQLVAAAHLADEHPNRLGLETLAVREAALAAFTAEVLRRADPVESIRTDLVTQKNPVLRNLGEAIVTGYDRAKAGEDDPAAPAGRFSGLAQYGDRDLIDAITRVDDCRFSHDVWIGVDPSNPAAPDEAHPTIPGYIRKTPEDKGAFLDAATQVLLRRMDAHRQPGRHAA